MKKNIIFMLSFTLITLCSVAQEELFIGNNGASLAYLYAIYEDDYPDYGIAASAFVNKSIAISVGFASNDGYANTLAGLTYYSKAEKMILRWFVGVSYGRIREAYPTFQTYYHYYPLLGLNVGFFKNFFPKSNFPFAVAGSVSAQKGIESYNENVNKIRPTAGFHFTQGFFAKGNIYPFIGLAFTHEFEYKINLYSASLGINVKVQARQKEEPKGL